MAAASRVKYWRKSPTFSVSWSSTSSTSATNPVTPEVNAHGTGLAARCRRGWVSASIMTFLPLSSRCAVSGLLNTQWARTNGHTGRPNQPKAAMAMPGTTKASWVAEPQGNNSPAAAMTRSYRV